MKKVIFIILSFSLLNCNYLFGQDVYSYYQDRKVFFKIDNENIIIKFNESIDRTTKEKIIYDKIENIQQIIEIESIKGLTFIKHEELPSSNHVFQLLNSFVEEPDIEYTSPVLLNEAGKVVGGLTDKFIVKLKPGVNFSKLKVLVEEKKTMIENKYPFDENVYFIRCNNVSNGNSMEMANEFYESGLFEYSEPDFLLYVYIATNDTYFDQQWGLNNTGQFNNGTPGDDIDAIRAWGMTTGCSSVRIAIIDTGVDLDHEDLDDNLEPGFDATGGNSNGSYTGSHPIEGHGTSCAGIAAAEGDNNQGIAGVAYDCRIVPIRGYRASSSPYSLTVAGWLAAAIDWAWQNNR